ncbi:MAG: ABC transporter ATP-binding protein/permease [Ruminococcus sp.]|nr:ABC transporter ATP-binding protein/permease [Ruminococcus sp.]
MMLTVGKPYRRDQIVMIAGGCITSACDSIFPLFNSYAIDNYIAKKTLSTLHIFIALYVGLLIFQVIATYVSTKLAGKVEVSVNRDLRDGAFTRLQSLSLSYFNSNSIGSIHSRVMSDTSKIGETVAWRLMDIVWSGAYLISVLINMAIVSPPLFVIILIMILFAALMTFFFQEKLIVINRRIRKQNSVLTGDMNEMITGLRAVKSMAIEGKTEKNYAADTEEMRRLSVRSGHYSAMFGAAISMVGALVLSVVLWRGGRLTTEGSMMIGSLSVFMSYAVGMLWPIQNIVTTLTQIVTIKANWERYIELTETPSDVSDTAAVIEKYGDAFNPKRENWEDMRGDIRFDRVSFTYPDGDTEVLTDFSLDVPRGSMTAIVGETGAGKSTLVNLVCRFYEPTAGRVLIDGRDIRERSVMWLHSHIGYVLQTPHLFSGTIRDNLKYGKPDATDEEITAALEAVSALDIVQSLEGGLDSAVGEGGGSLSTGQKQLISFARAVLADPDILILDEATASVDTITERKIQSAIKTLTDRRTSFVIAHRLSTITGADMIIAVHDGRIVESGTHKELIAKKGYYYKLYTRQHEDIDGVINR